MATSAAPAATTVAPLPAARGEAAVPAVPAVPPVPPVPASSDDASEEERGTDRVVTGGNVRIDRDEVVHDVTAMGGNVEVLGMVTGDVAAKGGNLHVHDGAHVRGDASAVGGSLIIDDGARIDGDVSVVGGVLQRGKGAEIHGEVSTGRGHRRQAVRRCALRIEVPQHDPARPGCERGEVHRDRRLPYATLTTSNRHNMRHSRQRLRAWFHIGVPCLWLIAGGWAGTLVA